ncbi:TetR/AcrR family transcriptional regulator [Kocuria varians]|uniref:HTH-type transcriptional regulator BetI n=1 Tax=Kocuria varians TaxID=1272 RepID=A0A7D7Q8V6_KOCVA|nr:TetR/AcrR family transcriptional regulator [Kocuria varians]QMS57643.1 HTH-type transcriptional regulator BetI [Kocuria varians]
MTSDGGVPPGSGTREKIAEAAIRVIAQQGFDVVSVRSVAQESGLSAGTVQYHFRTRKDLLVAALERSVERQTERVVAARGLPGYRASLCRALRELLPLEGVRHEDAAVWVSYGAAASTRDWLAELYWQAMRTFHDLVRAALERAQQDGKLRDGLTPETAAPLVTALVNGLTIDHLNAPDEVRAQVEIALDRGLQLILTD